MADDDDTGGESIDEIVERKLAERLASEEKKRNRAKPPKDFGEAADRFADAVWDRFDERRSQAEADANNDEAPDRSGGEKSGLAKWWGG